MDRRDWIRTCTALLAAPTTIARAQDRSAPVRIVVPYAAGGQTDLIARSLVPIVSRELQRNVIVENKPGAAALIATQYVQSAPPDGSTLLFHNAGFVALPLMSKTARYDPLKDFAPVARVGMSPMLLAINGNVPARTLAEFIAWAKAQPDGVTAANAGVNSAGHLSAQLFAKRAGIKVVHVAYKGTAETINALIAGDVVFQMTTATEVLTQQVRAGRLRLLGVASKDRSVLAPDVPTIRDTVPGFTNVVWFGLLAPAGTPADVVSHESAAFAAALADREIRERFVQQYMEPGYLDPAQFAREIEESQEFWKTMVKELGVQPT